MKVNRTRVRKRTFQHIEQELFMYKETKREIEQIRNEIIHGASVVDNPEGGKGNLPGDPTGRKGQQLADHGLLGNMERIIEKIDFVYMKSDKRTRDFIYEFYFTKPRTLTMEGIAQKLYMSRMQVYRHRTQVVRWVALELGWW